MVATLILDLLPKFSERLMKKVAARQIRKDKDQEGKITRWGCSREGGGADSAGYVVQQLSDAGGSLTEA